MATATTAPSSSTVGRGHVHAVEREVHRFADDEMDVPVDPGARVPASVLVRGRVDRDRVLLAVAQVLADRHREVRVAVRAVADERAVHAHRRAAVHALELDQDPLAAIGLGHDEGLLVLPDAAGEEAVARSAPSGSRVPPIIASWGRRTGTHGCAPPPSSSMKAFTFGRTRQSSLKEVRITMLSPDSG